MPIDGLRWRSTHPTKALLFDLGERVNIDRRFLVGMRVPDRGEDIPEPVVITAHLDPLFHDLFGPADLANRRIGAGQRLEAADTPDGKTAMRIIADPPGAGFAHRGTQAFAICFRDKHHDLVPSHTLPPSALFPAIRRPEGTARVATTRS